MSALHPRLAGPPPAALADAFAREGHVRVDDALAPGLAAELALVLRGLPLGPERAPGSVAWAGALGVPAGLDPQNPPCIHAAIRLLDQDLPAFVGALVGQPVARPDPGRLPLWFFRKGGYADDEGPLVPGGIDVLIGLTGGHWPAAWGGHLALSDRTLPPGFATLDLLRDRRFAVPLLTHHVEALWLRTCLVPT
ncbi:MAG: hypothetical protein R3F43_17480 [bacterium]